MRFIDQANQGNSSVSRYVLGIVFIVVGFVTSQLLILTFLPSFYPGLKIEELRSTSDFVAVMGKNGFFVYSLIPFVFLFLLILYTIKFIHKRRIQTAFTGRIKFDWRRVLISFFMMSCILMVIFGIQFYSEDTLIYNFNPNLFFSLLVAAILLIPIQITAEELLFRSYVLQGLKKRIRHNGHSVIISGIMFGMLHLANPEILKIGFHMVSYYIMAGIFLGAITLFDDGLELPIGYHAANNLFGAIMISSDWQAFQTNAVFIDTSDPGNGIVSIIFSIVLYILLFFIFYKIFNWKGLKEIWNQ